MTQSRRGSAIESSASTAIGFIVSWTVTAPILAAFGWHASASQAFGVTAIYTAISFVRGYAVRRLFNSIHNKGRK